MSRPETVGPHPDGLTPAWMVLRDRHPVWAWLMGRTGRPQPDGGQGLSVPQGSMRPHLNIT